MGIDLLDLVFRVERVFKIKLGIAPIIQQAKTVCPSSHRIDIQVRDFVRLVEHAIETQNPSIEGEVFELLRPHVAECLQVKESEVTLDAWMIHDLGME